jgi:Cytochrome c7 and related cytochrome c
MTRTACRAAAGVVVWVCLSSAALAQTGQTPPAAAGRFQAPVVTDTGSLKGPRQPIFFRHDIHAGQDRIPCLYCHATVTTSSEPGIPSLQTCIGCHQVVGGSTPSHQAGIKQVRDAWREKKAPEWVRVHALPGFVRFPHQRHIKALGTQSCTTCHGEVQRMPQVSQVSTLRMGWCVGCHVQRNVSRDCTVCHY